MRIVCIGQAAFGEAVLRKLTETGEEVVAVYAPPHSAGKRDPLRELAIQKGIAIFQPGSMRVPEVYEEHKKLKPDLNVMAFVTSILPDSILDYPRLGTIQYHPSLLPKHRGGSAINWAIINGETKTGVTTFYINERIDTGEIILQDKTAIHSDEKAGALHDRLMLLGAKLVLKTVALIQKDKVQPIVQLETGQLKAAPKIHRDTCKIDWTDSALLIYNKIRGLSPYPASWTNFYNPDKPTMLKVYKAAYREEGHSHDPGRLLLKDGHLEVAVPDGYITLQEIQISGKKKMTVKEFLNGHQIDNLAKLG